MFSTAGNLNHKVANDQIGRLEQEVNANLKKTLVYHLDINFNYGYQRERLQYEYWSDTGPSKRLSSSITLLFSEI